MCKTKTYDYDCRGDPKEIRTPDSAVKGRRLRPLVDGAECSIIYSYAGRHDT